jgi:hypothetical protein
MLAIHRELEQLFSDPQFQIRNPGRLDRTGERRRVEALDERARLGGVSLNRRRGRGGRPIAGDGTDREWFRGPWPNHTL